MATPAANAVVLLVGSAGPSELREWLGTAGGDLIERTPEHVPGGLAGYAAAVPDGRPCGQVGGDFYDVFRLDEQHVGFYVADAMGHGVPASLLTVFLKKVVQPKEVRGSTYRLVPPDEVLARVNRELIAQALAEQPFITMVYGLLN